MINKENVLQTIELKYQKVFFVLSDNSVVQRKIVIKTYSSVINNVWGLKIFNYFNPLVVVTRIIEQQITLIDIYSKYQEQNVISQ